jgi:hypothetical protein
MIHVDMRGFLGQIRTLELSADYNMEKRPAVKENMGFKD